jgi:hypothetical protein
VSINWRISLERGVELYRSSEIDFNFNYRSMGPTTNVQKEGDLSIAQGHTQVDDLKMCQQFFAKILTIDYFKKSKSMKF